jgi:hypothetical protein
VRATAAMAKSAMNCCSAARMSGRRSSNADSNPVGFRTLNSKWERREAQA